VSGEEKAARSCQVKTKKMSDKQTNASVENVLQTVSKVGARFYSTSSRGATCLLPRRHPAYSWHELGLGSGVERGNSPCDEKRKPYKCSPRKGKVSMQAEGADSPVVVQNFW
jgi:hypothetical protein